MIRERRSHRCFASLSVLVHMTDFDGTLLVYIRLEHMAV